MARGTQSGWARRLAIGALVLLLGVSGGCAKRHFYPGDRRPDAEIAYIEAERYLLADVAVEIDGRPAGSLAQYYIPPGVAGGWPPGKPTKAVSVLPGNHNLSIRVARYGWVSTGKVGCAALPFQAEAGRRYTLQIDNGALLLLNQATGGVVAQTSFASCPAT